MALSCSCRGTGASPDDADADTGAAPTSAPRAPVSAAPTATVVREDTLGLEGRTPKETSSRGDAGALYVPVSFQVHGPAAATRSFSLDSEGHASYQTAIEGPLIGIQLPTNDTCARVLSAAALRSFERVARDVDLCSYMGRPRVPEPPGPVAWTLEVVTYYVGGHCAVKRRADEWRGDPQLARVLTALEALAHEACP